MDHYPHWEIDKVLHYVGRVGEITRALSAGLHEVSLRYPLADQKKSITISVK